MKQRSIGIAILLTIVTCGIYGLYWFVCITDDTNDLADERDLAGGGMALLLTIVTCNIYGWYWAYKMGDKVDIIKNKNGRSSSNSGILFVVLQFFGLGIVNYIIAQDTINKYGVAFAGGYGQPNMNGQSYNMNGQPYNNGYNPNMNGQPYNNGFDPNMNMNGQQYNPYNNGYDQNMNGQDNGNNNNPYGGQ